MIILTLGTLMWCLERAQNNDFNRHAQEPFSWCWTNPTLQCEFIWPDGTEARRTETNLFFSADISLKNTHHMIQWTNSGSRGLVTFSEHSFNTSPISTAPRRAYLGLKATEWMTHSCDLSWAHVLQCPSCLSGRCPVVTHLCHPIHTQQQICHVCAT